VERNITIKNSLVKFLQSPSQAILMSQLIYWKPKSRNNWTYKDYHELSNETGMTISQLRTARNNLLSKKYLSTKVRKIKDKNAVHYKLTTKFFNDYENFRV